MTNRIILVILLVAPDMNPEAMPVTPEATLGMPGTTTFAIGPGLLTAASAVSAEPGWPPFLSCCDLSFSSMISSIFIPEFTSVRRGKMSSTILLIFSSFSSAVLFCLEL